MNKKVIAALTVAQIRLFRQHPSTTLRASPATTSGGSAQPETLELVIRVTAAAGIAAVAAMLAAGLFEYNFGDSEVLMLFLIIVTLPAAAARTAAA